MRTRCPMTKWAFTREGWAAPGQRQGSARAAPGQPFLPPISQSVPCSGVQRPDGRGRRGSR